MAAGDRPDADAESVPPATPLNGPAGPVQQTVCLALSLVVQNAAAAQQRDHMLAQAVVAAGVKALSERSSELPHRPAKGSPGKPPFKPPGRSPGRRR